MDPGLGTKVEKDLQKARFKSSVHVIFEFEEYPVQPQEQTTPPIITREFIRSIVNVAR